MLEEALAAGPSGGPLYHRLTRALDGLLGQDRLAPGAALPSERELARLAGVSRVTVRAALARLVEEGKLVRRQGSGTYVAESSILSRPLPAQPLMSLSDEMRRRGLAPSSRWLARGVHPPLSDEIMSLGLGMAERVARLERIRLADGRPLAVERTSLPASILPDPESVEGSLYDFLGARGVRPERAVQRLSAANATPRDAEALGILPGAAVLKVERISYLPGGRATEFSRSFFRGDVYDIVTELR